VGQGQWGRKEGEEERRGRGEEDEKQKKQMETETELKARRAEIERSRESVGGVGEGGEGGQLGGRKSGGAGEGEREGLLPIADRSRRFLIRCEALEARTSTRRHRVRLGVAD
jgi:hypothetical protein